MDSEAATPTGAGQGTPPVMTALERTTPLPLLTPLHVPLESAERNATVLAFMAHPRLTEGDKTYREDPAILLHLLFDTPHRLVAVDLLARQIPLEEAQAVWTAWSAFLTANDLDLTLTGHIATTAMAILRADIVTPHDKTEMVTYLQSLVQS